MKTKYQENRLYNTWYEFKKDLEKRSGYSVLNWNWIEVKPKAPLPWNGSHMEATIARLDEHKDFVKDRREQVSTGSRSSTDLDYASLRSV